MDFAKLSIDDLKKLRDTYREDLSALKKELQTVEKAMNNPDIEIVDEIQGIFETRYSSSNEHNANDVTDEDETKTQELLRAITQIKSLDITTKPIKNDGDTESYLYTCNGKFDKLHFEIEYESNYAFDDDPLNITEEHLTKLNIKILRPNLQPKLQKGIDFFQQHPNSFSSAILFLRSINDLIETRCVIVKKLYEFEKNLNIGISKSTEQHNIIFKSEFDNAEFLHIKWNFKWELRTGLARDIFTAKIVRADDQLMGEMKMLVEKLCTDKFAFESSLTDKVTLFRNIFTAIKDADTRNLLS